MTILWAYLAWLAAVAIYSFAVSREAMSRAKLSGSTLGRVSFMFAWYDMWCGCYYDRKFHRVFILPIPMFGVVIEFDAPASEE